MRSLVAAVLLLSLASHKGSAWKRAVEGTCPVTQRIPHNGTGAVFQASKDFRTVVPRLFEYWHHSHLQRHSQALH